MAASSIENSSALGNNIDQHLQIPNNTTVSNFMGIRYGVIRLFILYQND